MKAALSTPAAPVITKAKRIKHDCLLCGDLTYHDVCRSCAHSEPDARTPEDWQELERERAEESDRLYLTGEAA